jgi:hypothetical protein
VAARWSVHSARVLVLAAARAGALVHASTRARELRRDVPSGRCAEQRCQSRRRCGEGLSPVPVQMWVGLSPVPAQMWEGLSPVPAQMCRVKVPTMASHWRLEALRWYACVDYGASHRRWLLWTGIVSGQEALTFFLRTNLDMETLAQVPCHICTGTGLNRCHICTGTGPTAATSAPGLGAPLRCVDTNALASRGQPSASASLPLVTGA